jgi:hypothetical protein
MAGEASADFGAAGAVRAIRTQPEAEAVPALVALLEAKARPAPERAAAAVRLGRMPPGRADAALRAALGDPDPQVVRRAAEALGRVGGLDAGAALARTKPPADPAGARSLAFARLLHAARHDLDGPALPKGGTRAVLDPRSTASMEPSHPSPAQREALAGVLLEELPAIPVDPEGAAALVCGTNRFLVLPHARAAGLAGRGVAAVVLIATPSSSTSSPSATARASRLRPSAPTAAAWAWAKRGPAAAPASPWRLWRRCCCRRCVWKARWKPASCALKPRSCPPQYATASRSVAPLRGRRRPLVSASWPIWNTGRETAS